jgi:UPF0755 protein
VNRYGSRSSGSRWAAALVGGLLGLGLLAVMAWAVSERGADEEREPAPLVLGTTGASEPSVPVLRVVFPEGFTREQMARRVNAVRRIAREERGITPKLTAKAYRTATAKLRLPAAFEGTETDRMEGFLFPATYEFTEETTAKQLVDMQLKAFDRAWAQLDLADAEEKNLTLYDVLIIASMIEEEVQVPKERRLVSAVIYNRLRLGMTLGIDATLRYGLDIPPTQAILESQLADETPYNTRIHAGLPPTPISNPGLAALKAAVNPAEVDFLFFVRNDDCKSHFFTADEDEFFARVAGPRC